MEFTAKAIAEFLNGEVIGNPEVKVNNVAKIEEATPGTLAFLANPKYNKYLYTTEASIVLINKSLELENEVSATLIKVDNAYESFARLLELAEQARPVKQGVSSLAFIEESAKIGDGVYIAPFVYIGENAVIGDHVKLFPHVFIDDNVTVSKNTILNSGVKIYHECVIGEDCIIHAGAVVGSDGFGFAPDENNVYRKIPQLGNVIIEDNVEIGSNTTIDRATMGSTIIKKGAKLDNLNQIGHNVQIGENTVIAAQSGVAGSTKVGKNCQFGGQSGIAPHIQIADGVKVTPQAGIPNTIKEPGSIVMGTPAFNIREFQKSFIVYKQLPDLFKRVKQLENELSKLKSVE
ncbi:MAG TPA: UDP-3-O-(3-hydroxymyristoyl)glucosamine N-acyltransferase [Bacteroidales bacterium]|jgi:UDP-3-O-[3-hydroxymyristoyl] glucosamine N-acyltransferase|nr:UDP-3-O-(3-hydroxymyristoyl)glucosamine N-acyltransferase [Bacteroidales bacterium]